MSQNDITGLIVTYAYAFSLLIIATLIQKWRGYPPEFTRKIVHVGAGLAIFIILATFDNNHWYFGIIPTGTFVFFNYLSSRLRLIKAMDLQGDTLGTVYFPFSVTLLLAIFWSQNLAYIAVAGTMAMTWGDAAASILGRAFGKHPYFIAGHRRSFEGSGAMFIFSFVPILFTLLFMNTGLDMSRTIAYAFFLALIATMLEAVSLVGLDNIFVPIGIGMALWAMVIWKVDVPMIFGGLIISALIGAYAYRKRALSFSGVLGAIITGTFIFGFGGWVWGLTLIAFFVFGSVLSKYKETQKSGVAVEKFEKGSRRDIGQAFANGGLGAIIAVIYFLNPTQWLFAVFIGVMATVNGDTCATEIGVLSKRAPRMITSGKVVVPGTSGGITLLGSTAALLGGLAIGVSTWLFYGVYGLVANGNADYFFKVWIIIAGLVGGLAGTMFDSLLGATVQAMYINPQTGKETEKKIAKNGVKNKFNRGWRYMDNDMVNCLSSAMGGLVGMLVVLAFI
ncbi:DUF92 domain-containing protein [Candidatus Chlorohelix sp.]|uniref:DUF92 domain-containing protein n=1 Tax=Candidatus Chlorohelix sp. TaxID=3139201 RepID=UPI00306CF401